MIGRERVPLAALLDAALPRGALVTQLALGNCMLAPAQLAADGRLAGLTSLTLQCCTGMANNNDGVGGLLDLGDFQPGVQAFEAPLRALLEQAPQLQRWRCWPARTAACPPAWRPTPGCSTWRCTTAGWQTCPRDGACKVSWQRGSSV